MKTVNEFREMLETEYGMKRTHTAIMQQIKRLLKPSHYKLYSGKYYILTEAGVKKLLKYNLRPRAYLEKKRTENEQV